MSFGFSIGDFIGIARLAKDVKDRFVNAPKQLKALEQTVEALVPVLEHIENIYTGQIVPEWQRKIIYPILTGCFTVLRELQDIFDANASVISPKRAGLKYRARTISKRLNYRHVDVADMQQQLTTYLNTCNAFSGSILSQVVLEMKNAIHQSRESEDDRRFLEWLKPFSFHHQLAHFLSLKEPNTGEWFLSSAAFGQWIDDPGMTLLCPGCPGAGKTIMSAIVIQRMLETLKEEESLAFVFCNYKATEKQNAENLLLSLLTQLISGKPIAASVKKLLQFTSNSPKERPNRSQIVAALHAVVKEIPRTFLVVDALDECGSDSLESFLSELFTLQSRHGANLLATTRKIPTILDHFTMNVVHCEISASVGDVDLYVKNRLMKFTKLRGKDELQEQIRHRVKRTANGMFLIAKLLMDQLAPQMTIRAIRETLKTFSRGSTRDVYRTVYGNTIERIKNQHNEASLLALRILGWIARAKRPLFSLELQHALAVEKGAVGIDEDNFILVEDMLSVCAGLVTFEEETDIIGFAHYTVQEYVEHNKGNFFSDINVDYDIASTCITYLSFEAFATISEHSGPQIEERYPFFRYAIQFWILHTKDSPRIGRNEFLVPFLVNYRYSKCNTATYIERWHESTLGADGLHWAACLGVEETLEALLHTPQNLDVRDNRGNTPLCWATEHGHTAIVKILISRGCNMDLGDDFGLNPLAIAIMNDLYEIALNLINLGCYLDTEDFKGDTPLMQACKHGRKDIVERLLSTSEVDIDRQNQFGETALMIASANGQEDIVKALVASGVDLDKQDVIEHTALLRAFRNRSFRMIRILLYAKADLNLRDEDGMTALFFAVFRKMQEASSKSFQMPLEHSRYNINTKDSFGRTILARLAEKGQWVLADIVLKQDLYPAPHEPDNFGQTPLIFAAKSGHAQTVRLLSNYDPTGLNHQDRNGGSALSWAAREGHDEVVGILLQFHANANCKDKDGLTPLSLAIMYKHERIICVLLQHNADPFIVDKAGLSPLSLAIRSGRLEIFRCMLAYLIHPDRDYSHLISRLATWELVVDIEVERQSAKVRPLLKKNCSRRLVS